MQGLASPTCSTTDNPLLWEAVVTMAPWVCVYTLVSLGTSHSKGVEIITSWEYMSCVHLIPGFEVTELLTEMVLSVDLVG